jgi:hypothetical protein
LDDENNGIKPYFMILYLIQKNRIMDSCWYQTPLEENKRQPVARGFTPDADMFLLGAYHATD